MKRLLCKMALKIMLKEKDKIGLTGKQKSQVEALLAKVDRLQRRRIGMTITEILNIIHKERVELEIFEALSKWMINDRAEWISRAMDAESTIRCVSKIAKDNKSTKSAINGIINICDSTLED